MSTFFVHVVGLKIKDVEAYNTTINEYRWEMFCQNTLSDISLANLKEGKEQTNNGHLRLLKNKPMLANPAVLVRHVRRGKRAETIALEETMKVGEVLKQTFTPIRSHGSEVLAGYRGQAQKPARFPTSPSALPIVVGPERVTGRAISIDKAEQGFKKCISGSANPKRYGIQSNFSLFKEKNPACLFALNNIDSALAREMKTNPDSIFRRMSGISGTVYYGNKSTCFVIHTEDADLWSVSFLHAGAPKIWYVVRKESHVAHECLTRGMSR